MESLFKSWFKRFTGRMQMLKLPYNCASLSFSATLCKLTPDNWNLQGKLRKVRVIGSSSYRELRTSDRKQGKTVFTVYLYSYSVHF